MLASALARAAQTERSAADGEAVLVSEGVNEVCVVPADAETLLGLLQAIEMKVEMINRMAHLTPVRTYRSQVASGVAIETEFQILNTLLAEKAAQLAVTENQLFRIFCRWEGVDYDAANVVVTYPQRFELRDRRADLDFLVRAKKVTAKIGSPTLQREIDRQLARVVLERDDVLEVVEGELGGGGADRV